MKVTYNNEKMFTYIKGFAKARDWNDTLNALYTAREGHKNQCRHSGEPYIVHPLTVACHAMALGICEDQIIATALLHDWVEDCGGNIDLLQCSDRVKNAVQLLTFVKNPNYDKQAQLADYYNAIAKNRIATLVKLLDRCNNVSTMAGVFTKDKIEEYITETETFVLPLVRIAKEKWPAESDVLFALKYHIVAVTSGIKETMLTYTMSVNWEGA